jgi:hypothetical protein
MTWIGWTAAIGATVVTAYLTCAVRLFLTPSQRQFNTLKNRVTLPVATDVDPAATLDAMLRPGDDRGRWSNTRAASVEGVVVRVVEAGVESANCFSPRRRDVHIELARQAGAPPTERLIAEVTPPMRDAMSRQNVDWAAATLARDLVGKHVRIGGWLLFDRSHDDEAENTRPGHGGNWRRTAWEIHPVTSIQIVRSKPEAER